MIFVQSAVFGKQRQVLVLRHVSDLSHHFTSSTVEVGALKVIPYDVLSSGNRCFHVGWAATGSVELLVKKAFTRSFLLKPAKVIRIRATFRLLPVIPRDLFVGLHLPDDLTVFKLVNLAAKVINHIIPPGVGLCLTWVLLVSIHLRLEIQRHLGALLIFYEVIVGMIHELSWDLKIGYAFLRLDWLSRHASKQNRMRLLALQSAFSCLARVLW